MLNDLVDKIIVAVIIVAALVMVAICASYQIKYALKKADVEFKKTQINTLQIAEDIANQYQDTLVAYNTVKTFTDTTHTNNIVLLQFINDLEKILPTGTTINELSSANGSVSFKVRSTSKEAVADFIVSLKKLDYVASFSIPAISVTDIEGWEAPDVDVNDEEYVALVGDEYINSGEIVEYDFSCVLVDKDFVAGVVEVATDPSQVNEGGEQ